MNNQPVVTLKNLIQQYGIELTSDTQRTEALLNDLCPAYRREVFVLVNAQRQRVPADLLSSPKWMPKEAVAVRLSRRLQDRLALSESAADWAVDSWASALQLNHKQSGIAKLLIIARGSRHASRQARSKETKQRQSGEDDVQSYATVALPATSTPQDAVVDSAPNPAQSIHHRRYRWMAGSLTILAVVWLFSVSAWQWQPLSTLLAQLGSFPVRPPRLVESEYALPRNVWVTDGPLHVRDGPGISEQTLGMLQAGDVVQVSEFSSDAQWSHIIEPVEGWVSNWYLNFLTENEHEVPVKLLYQELVTASEKTPVHISPDNNSAIASYLGANIPIRTIAITSDGQWRQTVSPEKGWIPNQHLIPVD